MRKFEAKVKRGIELLDSTVKEWRGSIGTYPLYMPGCSTCVLGRVFGWYVDGLKSLGLMDGSESAIEAEVATKADNHGFTIFNDAMPKDWDTLANEWNTLANEWKFQLGISLEPPNE